MSVLFYGIGLIFIAIFMHFFLWKIHIPANHTKALLQIFFGILIGGIFILWRFSTYIVFFDLSAPRTMWEYVQLCLLFISLASSYMATYSAVETDSPSLLIVTNVAKAGPDGLDKNTLEQNMGNDILMLPKVRELIAGGMIYLNDQVYKLTPKGIFVARIFIIYRKLLKRTRRGG